MLATRLNDLAIFVLLVVAVAICTAALKCHYQVVAVGAVGAVSAVSAVSAPLHGARSGSRAARTARSRSANLGGEEQGGEGVGEGARVPARVLGI
jgi:hypothetical protein